MQIEIVDLLVLQRVNIEPDQLLGARQQNEDVHIETYVSLILARSRDAGGRRNTWRGRS